MSVVFRDCTVTGEWTHVIVFGMDREALDILRDDSDVRRRAEALLPDPTTSEEQ